jgi:AcrR family transcriptional regulator
MQEDFPSSDFAPELKQARSRLSTGRLLRAAASLIAERGYERTTLAAVGARAGYSHGLVTRRFGSKDGLLDALLQRMVADWYQREVTPLQDELTGGAALSVVIRSIRASIRRDPLAVRALYTLMFEAHRSTPAVLHERMREFHRKQRRSYEDAIKAGIEHGTVDPAIDPIAIGHLAVSTLRGAGYQWLLDEDFDIDATLAALEEHLLKTLEPRSQDRLISKGANV